MTLSQKLTLRSLTCGIFVVLTFGCQDKPEPSADLNLPLTDLSIDEETFAKAKMIPDKARDRLRQAYGDFKQNTAISQLLQSENLVVSAKDLVELQEYVNGALISSYLNSLELTVTDEELQSYYAAHKAEFAQTNWSVKKITFRLPKNSNKSQVAELSAEANSLTNGVKAFEDIPEAAQYSLDAKATEIDSESTRPEISSALASVNEGEFSGPVVLDNSIYVFYVDSKEEIVKPLEEVREAVSYQLKSAKQQDEIQRLTAVVSAKKTK